MASISITVPDALVPRVLAALRANHADVDVDGLGNGPAAKKILAAILRSEVADYEARTALQAGWQSAGVASETARATAGADAVGIV